LEIGTGSGAVSIAVAKEFPQARIFATDINLQALDLAKNNASKTGVVIEFFACDLFSAIRPGKTFHVIFSNPPYVKSSIIPTLDPEINFEPVNALDGGPDGLDVIRKMVPAANSLLRRGGELIIEMAADQENDVGKIFSDAGYADVSVYRDLSGRPRVMSGKTA
jgi:release factor glutamine methyltransferase